MVGYIFRSEVGLLRQWLPRLGNSRGIVLGDSMTGLEQRCAMQRSVRRMLRAGCDASRGRAYLPGSGRTDVDTVVEGSVWGFSSCQSFNVACRMRSSVPIICGFCKLPPICLLSTFQLPT